MIPKNKDPLTGSFSQKLSFFRLKFFEPEPGSGSLVEILGHYCVPKPLQKTKSKYQYSVVFIPASLYKFSSFPHSAFVGTTRNFGKGAAPLRRERTASRLGLLECLFKMNSNIWFYRYFAMNSKHSCSMMRGVFLVSNNTKNTAVSSK